MNLGAIYEKLEENRGLHEVYFLILCIVLAFGILQTLGTGLDTEKPVVTVTTPSMCPNIHIGDILVVNNEDYSEIQEGDIVVFDVPDRAEFTVNGEEFVLEASEKTPSEEIETDIGTVQLVDVRASTSKRSRDSGLFRINGSIPQRNGQNLAFMEGNSYSIGGGTMNIDYLTDLPRGNVPIVHRVIEKNDDFVQTLGDNNERQLEFEDNIRPDQIHGTVAFKIPRIGLLKIVLMDLVGYSGEEDQAFVLDNTPSCASS
mgnify:CR=1 FL=1